MPTMDDLDLIRQKIDIISLISEYIPLKKAGRNFKALCPFHSEKSPSFIVSPERQIWHCFGGCGTGGDIFSFLMKYENIEFPEALRILAKRAGVVLADYRPTEASKLKDRLYEINHLASEFYHYLLVSHPVGKKALDYVLSRGISKKSIETFSLGYAPNLWDGLIKFLVGKKKYQIEDLDKAGLVIYGRGQYYDRFRGRLMFTLKDHLGNVIGFAGRLLPEGEKQRKEGKYVNSPETPIYVKSNVLYNLDITHKVIKKENKAVVVEGEIDAIASFQAGVPNVVAIKGSALTERQISLLKRYTDNLILALDMDLAGDSAARRGIEIAENADLEIKVVQLPFGKDPGDCAIKSPDLWKKAIREAIPVFDFLLTSASRRFNKEMAEGKRKIAQEFLSALAKINNEIIKAHYLKKLANLIEVPQEAVTEELNKIARKQTFKAAPLTVTGKQVRDRQELLEEYLLAILLQTKRQKPLLDFLFKDVADSDFKNLAVKKVMAVFREFINGEKIFKIDLFVKRLPAELIPLVDRLYLFELDKNFKDENLEEKEVRKMALEIKKLSLRRKIKEITEKIRKAGDNDDLLVNLNGEFKKLTQELHEISR